MYFKKHKNVEILTNYKKSLEENFNQTKGENIFKSDYSDQKNVMQPEKIAIAAIYEMGEYKVAEKAVSRTKGRKSERAILECEKVPWMGLPALFIMWKKLLSQYIIEKKPLLFDSRTPKRGGNRDNVRLPNHCR